MRKGEDSSDTIVFTGLKEKLFYKDVSVIPNLPGIQKDTIERTAQKFQDILTGLSVPTKPIEHKIVLSTDRYVNTPNKSQIR